MNPTRCLLSLVFLFQTTCVSTSPPITDPATPADKVESPQVVMIDNEGLKGATIVAGWGDDAPVTIVGDKPVELTLSGPTPRVVTLISASGFYTTVVNPDQTEVSFRPLPFEKQARAPWVHSTEENAVQTVEVTVRGIESSRLVASFVDRDGGVGSVDELEPTKFRVFLKNANPATFRVRAYNKDRKLHALGWVRVPAVAGDISLDVDLVPLERVAQVELVGYESKLPITLEATFQLDDGPGWTVPLADGIDPATGSVEVLLPPADFAPVRMEAGVDPTNSVGWFPYALQYAEASYDVPVPDAMRVTFEQAPGLLPPTVEIPNRRDGYAFRFDRPVAGDEVVHLAFMGETGPCNAPWTVLLPPGASSFEPGVLPIVGDPLPSGVVTVAMSMERNDGSRRFQAAYGEEFEIACGSPSPDWLVGRFEGPDFYLQVTKCGRFVGLNKRVTSVVSAETFCGSVSGEGAKRLLTTERILGVHPGLVQNLKGDEQETWVVEPADGGSIDVTRDGETVSARPISGP